MRKTHLGGRALVALLGLTLFLGACSAGNDDTETLGEDPYLTEGNTARVFAQYEPGVEVMPLPNDVVWSADEDPASPAVELPATGALAQLAPVINAQGLLGLSPNMFLTIPVTGEVDASTLRVLVFRLDDAQHQELPRTEASFQVLYEPIDDADPTTPVGVLKLLPNRPFTAGAAYAVAVKMGLEDASGYEVHPSFAMQALKSTEPFSPDSPYYRLEALRAKYNEGGLFAGVAQATQAVYQTPWAREDVLAVWTFHTAGVSLDLPASATSAPSPLPYANFGAKLQAFKGLSAAKPADPGLVWLNPATGEPAAGPVGIPVAATPIADALPDVSHLKNLYAGLFQSPDLSTAGATTTPVSFTLVTPAAGAPPYPVVVFQHGINRDKTDAFALANALAAEGLAVLAIDAPLHGDRAKKDAQGNSLPSGTGFFTANLFADRLNLYQAGMDLWETFDLLEETGIDLDGAAGFDLTSPRFVSHSLGSIIGSVFLSQDTRPEAIFLSSPAAQLSNVLDEIALPDLKGLAASLGYTRGKTDYYVFLNLAQWLLDPVDSAYTKIGANSLDKLLAVYAFDDPIVSASSSRTFLAGVGVNLATGVTVVDPDEVVPGVFPDTSAAAYQYGVPGKPVLHSFLLAPLFDVATEPWYAGYDETDQVHAWLGAQAQAATFLGDGQAVAGQ